MKNIDIYIAFIVHINDQDTYSKIIKQRAHISIKERTHTTRYNIIYQPLQMPVSMQHFFLVSLQS